MPGDKARTTDRAAAKAGVTAMAMATALMNFPFLPNS